MGSAVEIVLSCVVSCLHSKMLIGDETCKLSAVTDEPREM